ncbi:cytochrome P450 oxidoreductase [Colletotrichum tofieldiae]|nr:cytochrome P450 oxidoreductase [Colletotrichum tofieldiae]
MKDSSLIVGFGTALLVIYVISKLLQARKNAGLPPLPPGPKSLPLIGNLRDMPTSDIFAPHHWIKHKDLYGPISCVNVLGNTLIIINDAQIAFDLFEKQSLTFSSRPELTFLNIFILTLARVGWNDGTGGLPYNETLRIHRKNFARIIGTKATASQFNKLQEAEVAHFLLHVLDDPENFEKHIQKLVVAILAGRSDD